jgi:hypothetical protein
MFVFAILMSVPDRFWLSNMLRLTPKPTLNLHLPPHLREVCAILAAGLVRLRAHSAEDLARDAERARGRGESSLHFLPEQSGGAAPQTQRHA